MVKQSELLSSMTEEQWLDLYNRLRLFTYKRYYWLRNHTSLDVEDIIHEAIMDTYEGKRRWPPEVNLVVFLCGVISSKVSHLWERERKKLSLESFSENTSVQGPQLEDSPNKEFEALLKESATEYLNLLSRKNLDDQLLYQEVTNKMLNLVSHDEKLTKIVQLWLEEPDIKPRQIAEKMGLTSKQIYQVQKRLRKYLENLQGELQNG